MLMGEYYSYILLPWTLSTYMYMYVRLKTGNETPPNSSLIPDTGTLVQYEGRPLHQHYIFIWSRKLNLPVDSSGSEKGGVQDVYPISCHDNFNTLGGFKPIQLVQQFQHRTLDFTIAWCVCVCARGYSIHVNSV